MTPEEKIQRVWQLLSEAMKGRPLSDRLAHLSWLLLLKYIDDYDAIPKSESAQSGKLDTPILESDYRWPIWVYKALSTSRVNGKRLSAFQRNGLFTYLASLKYLPWWGTMNNEFGGSIPGKLEIHETLYNIFCREKISIYDAINTLKEILSLINAINFQNVEQRSAIASLYDGYLQDMEFSNTSARDFFTPRAVVRTMVKMLEPQPNQVIIDPACGTGRFLVEAHKYMQAQCDQQVSQSTSLFGRSLDSADALISMINIASIGIPVEHICHSDTLEGYPEHFPGGFKCVLTNPPFGTIEDDRAERSPFLRTLHYAPPLLQQCIDIISGGGISGVIVSITTLTRDPDAFIEVRERLLTECDLSMVIVLPSGAFAPRTSVRTAILFFQKPGSTTETLYYNVHLSEESLKRKQPLSEQDFVPALEVWEKWRQYRISGEGRPAATENCWIEVFDDETFRKNKYRLGTHSPSVPTEDLLQPEELIDLLLEYDHQFYHFANDLPASVELKSQLLRCSQNFHQQLSALHENIGKERFFDDRDVSE